MNRLRRLGATAARALPLTIVLISGYLDNSQPGLAQEETTAGSSAGTQLPTGQTITPAAAKGAIFQDLNPGHPARPRQRARQADALARSPDGHMLAILTGEYNAMDGRDGKPIPELSTESVFLFDITGHQPKLLQVLALPHTYEGIAWSPASDRLFVSGGTDDAVLEFTRSGLAFTKSRCISLGHRFAIGLADHKFHDALWGDVDTSPMAGALAVSPDGTQLLVANFMNDSVSLIDLASGRVVAEQDLRPGIIDPKHRGELGGSYPRCVSWASPSRVYVGSERDREIISLEISGEKIRVVRRMPVHGQPLALLVNRRGSRLYAALDNTDQVAVFDTARDALIEQFNVVAPEAVYANASRLGGANPDGLALTPNEDTLLVSNGGENAVAVVRLSDRARGKDTEGDDDDAARGARRSAVIGLVPTGWYPAGVVTSADGATWHVINGKSPTGSSAHWCHRVNPATGLCVTEDRQRSDYAENGFAVLSVVGEFNFQLERAGFLTMPAPASLELARLTEQVARNNHFIRPETSEREQRLLSFLHEHIKHVIYIIKENRTYDQILGDLKTANGDPRLTIFPERLSPNHHVIARDFVTLDNFTVSGEGSWTGWDWSTAARINDFREHQEGGFGGGDEWGANRTLNMGLATSAERHEQLAFSPTDPDILPGARDVAELDGPGGEEGKGYIWDAALRRGLTVRNYGFFEMPYSTTPLVRDAFEQKTRVFFPTKAALAPLSDPYYRGWDPAFPDFWRFREWQREFDGFVASKSAPNLMLVQLGNDHLGNFDRAIDGVNTPDTQMSDNDYALGMILETVASSPFANDTLMVAIEDDTCDGPDHVDAFRSVLLVAGPYVRRHAVVSKRYTTVNVVKTIEEVLGIGPIGLNDALAAPISDVFDASAAAWSYKAIVPDVLRSTELPLPAGDNHADIVLPRHTAAYWAKAMAGQDFSGPDRVDSATFNRALWRGLKVDVLYPNVRDLNK